MNSKREGEYPGIYGGTRNHHYILLGVKRCHALQKTRGNYLRFWSQKSKIL